MLFQQTLYFILRCFRIILHILSEGPAGGWTSGKREWHKTDSIFMKAKIIMGVHIYSITSNTDLNNKSMADYNLEALKNKLDKRCLPWVCWHADSFCTNKQNKLKEFTTTWLPAFCLTAIKRNCPLKSSPTFMINFTT